MASWSAVHQSPVWRLIKCTVHKSPLCGFYKLVHRLPKSSVRLIKCTIHQYPLCAFYKRTVHQSPVLCLYKGYTNLHCCASTVALFYSVAPFVSYYFVPCDYATRQFYIINNFATDVNMPCRLFNCVVEISVLATTEHVSTCRCIYSTVVIQLH